MTIVKAFFSVVILILSVLSIQAFAQDCETPTVLSYENMSLEQFQCLSDEDKATFLDSVYNPNITDMEVASLELTPEERETLYNKIKTAVSNEQHLWWDTVLEGPYHLTANAQAVEQYALLFQGKIYGYYLVVAAPATFDNEGEEVPGSISVIKHYDSQFQEIENGYFADFEHD